MFIAFIDFCHVKQCHNYNTRALGQHNSPQRAGATLTLMLYNVFYNMMTLPRYGVIVTSLEKFKKVLCSALPLI